MSRKKYTLFWVARYTCRHYEVHAYCKYNYVYIMTTKLAAPKCGSKVGVTKDYRDELKRLDNLFGT